MEPIAGCVHGGVAVSQDEQRLEARLESFRRDVLEAAERNLEKRIEEMLQGPSGILERQFGLDNLRGMVQSLQAGSDDLRNVLSEMRRDVLRLEQRARECELWRKRQSGTGSAAGDGGGGGSSPRQSPPRGHTAIEAILVPGGVPLLPQLHSQQTTLVGRAPLDTTLDPRREHSDTPRESLETTSRFVHIERTAIVEHGEEALPSATSTEPRSGAASDFLAREQVTGDLSQVLHMAEEWRQKSLRLESEAHETLARHVAELRQTMRAELVEAHDYWAVHVREEVREAVTEANSQMLHTAELRSALDSRISGIEDRCNESLRGIGTTVAEGQRELMNRIEGVKRSSEHEQLEIALSLEAELGSRGASEAAAAEAMAEVAATTALTRAAGEVSAMRLWAQQRFDAQRDELSDAFGEFSSAAAAERRRAATAGEAVASTNEEIQALRAWAQDVFCQQRDGLIEVTDVFSAEARQLAAESRKERIDWVEFDRRGSALLAATAEAEAEAAAASALSGRAAGDLQSVRRLAEGRLDAQREEISDALSKLSNVAVVGRQQAAAGEAAALAAARDEVSGLRSWTQDAMRQHREELSAVQSELASLTSQSLTAREAAAISVTSKDLHTFRLWAQDNFRQQREEISSTRMELSAASSANERRQVEAAAIAATSEEIDALRRWIQDTLRQQQAELHSTRDELASIATSTERQHVTAMEAATAAADCKDLIALRQWAQESIRLHREEISASIAELTTLAVERRQEEADTVIVTNSEMSALSARCRELAAGLHALELRHGSEAQAALSAASATGDDLHSLKVWAQDAFRKQRDELENESQSTAAAASKDLQALRTWAQDVFRQQQNEIADAHTKLASVAAREQQQQSDIQAMQLWAQDSFRQQREELSKALTEMGSLVALERHQGAEAQAVKAATTEELHSIRLWVQDGFRQQREELGDARAELASALTGVERRHGAELGGELQALRTWAQDGFRQQREEITGARSELTTVAMERWQGEAAAAAASQEVHSLRLWVQEAILQQRDEIGAARAELSTLVAEGRHSEASAAATTGEELGALRRWVHEGFRQQRDEITDALHELTTASATSQRQQLVAGEAAALTAANREVHAVKAWAQEVLSRQREELVDARSELTSLATERRHSAAGEATAVAIAGKEVHSLRLWAQDSFRHHREEISEAVSEMASVASAAKRQQTTAGEAAKNAASEELDTLRRWARDSFRLQREEVATSFTELASLAAERRQSAAGEAAAVSATNDELRALRFWAQDCFRQQRERFAEVTEVVASEARQVFAEGRSEQGDLGLELQRCLAEQGRCLAQQEHLADSHRQLAARSDSSEVAIRRQLAENGMYAAEQKALAERHRQLSARLEGAETLLRAEHRQLSSLVDSSEAKVISEQRLFVSQVQELTRAQDARLLKSSTKANVRLEETAQELAELRKTVTERAAEKQDFGGRLMQVVHAESENTQHILDIRRTLASMTERTLDKSILDRLWQLEQNVRQGMADQMVKAEATINRCIADVEQVSSRGERALAGRLREELAMAEAQWSCAATGRDAELQVMSAHLRAQSDELTAHSVTLAGRLSASEQDATSWMRREVREMRREAAGELMDSRSAAADALAAQKTAFAAHEAAHEAVRADVAILRRQLSEKQAAERGRGLERVELPQRTRDELLNEMDRLIDDRLVAVDEQLLFLRGEIAPHSLRTLMEAELIRSAERAAAEQVARLQRRWAVDIDWRLECMVQSLQVLHSKAGIPIHGALQALSQSTGCCASAGCAGGGADVCKASSPMSPQALLGCGGGGCGCGALGALGDGGSNIASANCSGAMAAAAVGTGPTTSTPWALALASPRRPGGL